MLGRIIPDKSESSAKKLGDDNYAIAIFHTSFQLIKQLGSILGTIMLAGTTIKDTSTIMHNPSLHNSVKGVTHVCTSILDSIAKRTSCFHYFSHGASLHRHSFS